MGWRRLCELVLAAMLCAAGSTYANEDGPGRDLLASNCVVTLPWSNPNVLANYAVAAKLAPTRKRPSKRPSKKPSSRTLPAPAETKKPTATTKKTYPYRKYLQLDKRYGQWNYRPLTIKRGCQLKFLWAIIPNLPGKLQMRGVATSKISVCNTNPTRYKILKRAAAFSSYSVSLQQKGVFYYWDPRGRWPGKPTPSQTSDPFDQWWESCQWGVYISVRVV